MKMPKHSLRKIVKFLNNPDEDGGFWLPNIQRPFVWKEDQIYRLYDSIMRQYPIGTLLIWKTKSPIRRRKFIENYKSSLKLGDFYIPEDDKKKCLVLDGQQRLQSLFIGLCGSYEEKELFLDILSGEISAPDDIKFKFDFLSPTEANFPWIRFKDLVFSKDDPVTAAEKIISRIDLELSAEDKKKIGHHVGLVFKTFHSDDGIAYEELDSIEEESLYTEDDVVEVFIRANAGGTKLGKSDLLFSLLNATWDRADREMEDLLEDLNQHGFAFDRDFVLKTCLCLLGTGAQYQVEKFRRPHIRESIERDWGKIAIAIKDVLDFIREKTYIHCDKALPSYLALIPLIYLRYRHIDAWRSARDIENYLLRTLLSGAFSFTPDQLINDCINKIDGIKTFEINAIFEAIRSKGRSLELTEDRFWQMGYGSDNIHLLFNIWYRDFNYTPAYDNNLPEVDHIFPQSLLKKAKIINPETGKRNVMRYPASERNQLANCMLLKKGENGPGGKGDSPPEEWFKDKDEQYLDIHLIPKNRDLWKLDRFDDFIAERKKLIAEKFAYLIVKK